MCYNASKTKMHLTRLAQQICNEAFKGLLHKGSSLWLKLVAQHGAQTD